MLWLYAAAAGAPPSRSAETCALWLLCFVALGLRIGSDEPSQHERAQARTGQLWAKAKLT